MKRLVVLFFLLNIMLAESCKKEDSAANQNGYILCIPSDSDMAVVASFEVDGNFMLIGRSYNDEHPGVIIKLDKKGNVIWNKKLSSLNKVLWKVLELPDGFITLGHSGDNFMTACTYDNDGNLISTSNINIPTGSNATICAPGDIIQLKNGNFAISGYDGNSFLGYLIITGNAFDSLYTKTFNLPYNSFGSVFGLVETTDGSIVLRTAPTDFGNTDPFSNLLLIRTDLTGTLRSSTRLTDSLYSETPNCLIANNNGMLAVTSRMKGWNEGEGFYVNYYNNNYYRYISGSINLLSFTTEGQLLSRKKISSYPGNGMISSIKTTGDGGYILCGTVNQSNSSTLVSKTKIYLLKLDAGLGEQWSHTFNTTYQSFGISAFQSSDGGYVVTGHEHTFDSKYNMMIIKTDDMGNVY